MVEMASLPLARCSSAICRSPGKRRPIPVRGELHCANTCSWSLLSSPCSGECVGWSPVLASPPLPFPLSLALVCPRAPLMLRP
eukprot:5224930-Pyramimonas_sp.AAC.1